MNPSLAQERDCLPGRPRAGWWLAAAALLGCVGFGVFGYAQQRLHGDVVTGLRTIGQGGAAWGLYIVMDITFVGLAFGGIVFMTIVRLFHLRTLRPLTRMAQILTLVSLGMAGLCVIADLGRPLQGLINFPRYARTMSPFFGTFSLVTSTGSVATFIYLWLDSRADAAACAARGGPLRIPYTLWAGGWRNTPEERLRHRQTSWWLSLTMLPFMVVGVSTLGFVFGIQAARPGWFSTLQAPGFVVLALISSFGILIVMAAVARRASGRESEIRPEVFRWLGNVLWMLTAVYLYIVVIENLTSGYAASQAETRVANATIAGPWARPFWIAMVCFALPAALLFAQFVRRTSSIVLTVTCALLLNVAALLKRFLLVVPSQTDGLLLPYDNGHYSPTWVELAVAGGLIALGILACLVFARVLPIVPLHVVPHGEPSASAARGQSAVRIVLTGATLLIGATLAVAGFLLSARMGTDSWQDPLVPMSPVIFITGMVIVFGTAVVYEILPARGAWRRRPEPPQCDDAPSITRSEAHSVPKAGASRTIRA